MTKSQSQHKAGDLVVCTFGLTLHTLGLGRDLCIFLGSYADSFYETSMVTLLGEGRVFNVNEGYVRRFE
jgi:hypothetical protein